MLGYEAIRYVPGYPESYVKIYGTDYAAASVAAAVAAKDAEIEALRGERSVLVDMLRECDAVISTIDAENADEDEMLHRLLGAIKRVTLLRDADQRDLLSIRAGSAGAGGD